MLKLVPDWKQCWRWYSVHASTIGLIFTSVAGALAMAGSATAWRGMYDDGVVLLIAAVLFALALAGRLISQSK